MNKKITTKKNVDKVINSGFSEQTVLNVLSLLAESSSAKFSFKIENLVKHNYSPLVTSVVLKDHHDRDAAQKYANLKQNQQP
jgi:hypothetical protein